MGCTLWDRAMLCAMEGVLEAPVRMPTKPHPEVAATRTPG